MELSRRFGYFVATELVN